MKKSILIMSLIALGVTSASAIAAKDPAAAFAKHKENELGRIEQKLACGNAAQDVNQLKKCFPKRKLDSKAATANFAEHKQKILDQITQRRDCVTAAQDKNALKVCNAKPAKASAPAPGAVPAVVQ
jgi:hypothetical protein